MNHTLKTLRGDAGLSVHERRRAHVLILIFENLDILALTGPYAVFTAAEEGEGGPMFQVRTVAESPSSVRAMHGLKLVPDLTLEQAPRPDILIIPGGPGTRPLLSRPSMLEWIATRSATAGATLGVGSGVELLKTSLPGMADDVSHADHSSDPAAVSPASYPDLTRRIRTQPHPAGAGTIVTSRSAGAGIEASLAVLRNMRGDLLASATARGLDVPWLLIPE